MRHSVLYQEFDCFPHRLAFLTSFLDKLRRDFSEKGVHRNPLTESVSIALASRSSKKIRKPTVQFILKAGKDRNAWEDNPLTGLVHETELLMWIRDMKQEQGTLLLHIDLPNA